MIIKYFFSGFFVKIITGVDDSMVHIPIIANMAKTRKGRIAFAIGIFLAISFAILLSFLFAEVIRSIKYYNIFSATLILLLAISIYFDIFLIKPRKEVEKKLKTKEIQKEIKIKKISLKRFLKLMGAGFLTAFATVIDDTIAYSALFLTGAIIPMIYVITGILTATIMQLTLIVYFSKKIQKIPYKKNITIVGLILLSALIFFKIL